MNLSVTNRMFVKSNTVFEAPNTSYHTYFQYNVCTFTIHIDKSPLILR